MPDDREVAHVPRERIERDAVRRVEAHEGRTRYAKNRFQVALDVHPVLQIELARVAQAERREPPRHVVIPGNDDRSAHALRLSNELAGALELSGPRALRHVARDRDDVVVPLLDEAFDCLVLLRHRRMAEVQVGAVEDGQRAHSLAITASVNWSVDALPPRSRVTVIPSRIVPSSAARMRAARVSSPVCSSSMHAARMSADGFAIPLPAMSGAVPCTASKIAPLAPMLAPGVRPSPPTSPEISSDRISPKRFVVQITSNRSGCSTRFIAIASTIRSSNSILPA